MCSGLDSYRRCEVWGRSVIAWLSYNNFYSHGETSKLWCRQGHAHQRNSSSSQFNITKAFRLNWPKYYVDVIKSLGGVSYRVKHVTSCFQQVRYDYNWIWSLRSLQVRILIKNVKFGADRTLHAWDITTSCFMAKHRNLTGRHGHALRWKL